MPSGVYTEVINLPIVLCPHEVQHAVVSERTPLGVDQDVLFVRIFRSVEHLAVVDPFDVARIAAGACCCCCCWYCSLFHNYGNMGESEKILLIFFRGLRIELLTGMGHGISKEQ